MPHRSKCMEESEIPQNLTKLTFVDKKIFNKKSFVFNK